MSYDMWGADAIEPTYPEPTDADYCAMSGHEPDMEGPDSYDRYCHCGDIYYPAVEEPHDEYSAYCADLIDQYVDTVVALSQKRKYPHVPGSLQIDTRRVLRNKDSEYLQRLIANLEASKDFMVREHAPFMDERYMEFYSALGFHLDYDSTLIIRTIVNHLGGNKGFRASDHNSHYPSPITFLDREDVVQAARRAINFYRLLIPSGLGSSWQSTAIGVLIAVLPLLEHRPDLVDSMAALFNLHGYGPAVIGRVVSLADGEAPSTALVDGIL